MGGKTKDGGGSKKGGKKKNGGTVATPVILALDSTTAQVISYNLNSALRHVSGGKITMDLPEQTALIFNTALSAGIQASERKSGKKSGGKKTNGKNGTGKTPNPKGGGGKSGGGKGGGKSGGKSGGK